MQAQYLLKIVKNNKEQYIPIKNSLVIGRDEEMDLFIEDPSVSSKHASIEIKKGTAYIEDFGSTNGTFVNSNPVKEVMPLKNNDIVTIGNFKCLFVNTQEKTKKYVTVVTQQSKLRYLAKVLIADKKLEIQEVLQKNTQSPQTIHNHVKAISNCEGSVSFPQFADLDFSSPCSGTEIQIIPLEKRETKLELCFQKNNDIIQRMTIPLKHYAHYAHKFIRLALFTPILFFILDSIVFKAEECSFLVAIILKMIYALGGFTLSGIFLGIVFMIFGILFYNRSQEINLFHKEIEA